MLCSVSEGLQRTSQCCLLKVLKNEQKFHPAVKRRKVILGKGNNTFKGSAVRHYVAYLKMVVIYFPSTGCWAKFKMYLPHWRRYISKNTEKFWIGAIHLKISTLWLCLFFFFFPLEEQRVSLCIEMLIIISTHKQGGYKGLLVFRQIFFTLSICFLKGR